MKPATRRKAAPARTAMVRMTLNAEHEHLGAVLAPGTAISVHPETARWLEAMGVAAPVQTTTRSATPPVNTKE